MPIPFHYTDMLSGTIVELPDAWRCNKLSPSKQRLLGAVICLFFLAIVGYVLFVAISSEQRQQEELRLHSLTTRNTFTTAPTTTTETMTNTSTTEVEPTTHSNDFYPVRLFYEEHLRALLEATKPDTPAEAITKQALPLDPHAISAVTLLFETLSDNPVFYEIPCTTQIPPVYQEMVEVGGVNYTGQSSIEKDKAMENAAQQAATALWGLEYHEPDPSPHPCIPNNETVTESTDEFWGCGTLCQIFWPHPQE